jgi:hypothetical protein
VTLGSPCAFGLALCAAFQGLPPHAYVEWVSGVQVSAAADVPLAWHWAHRCHIPFEDPVELPPMDSVPPELEEKFSLRPGPDLLSFMPAELRGMEGWMVVKPASARKDARGAESSGQEGHNAASARKDALGAESSGTLEEEGHKADPPDSSPPPSQCHLIARAANPGEIGVGDLQKQSPGSNGISPVTPSKVFQGLSFFRWKRR